MNNDDLIARDLNVLWHPCSQMKDYETFRPISIQKAKGGYLFTSDGNKIFDAISSWWCKNLGHGHPRLIKALTRQAAEFEHVILTNTTNEVIVALSERLTGFTRQLKKIMYASDGSSAVEMALKLACHARIIRGQTEKRRICSLANSYHGETLFALAVSDIGIYRTPFESYLPEVSILQSIPYVNSRHDPLWQDCASAWSQVEAQLNTLKDQLSVIIIESIVQGAGGMQIYSQDFLARLRAWCNKHDVYLIADEIMTGCGRTGKMFACEHAGIEPDFLCLGKGLTSGMLPLSCVLLTNEVYQLFYQDYELGNSFLHSHTLSGNALGCAVALECLNVLRDEAILQQVIGLEKLLYQAMAEVVAETPLVNLRGIGGLVAADVDPQYQGRVGYQIYQEAVKLGVFLRPLGNTLYWLPPLNTKVADIKKLRDRTIKAIRKVIPASRRAAGSASLIMQ